MSTGSGPIHLLSWIEENRENFKPPVGNKEVFPLGDFVVMIIKGPNARKDYHVDPGPELFYQLEGAVSITTYDDQKEAFSKIEVTEGQLYLLPSNVPHHILREKDSLGLVIETRRKPGQSDFFRWFCDRCQKPLYSHECTMENLDQVKDILDVFYSDSTLNTCSYCGHQTTEPQK